MEQTLTIKENPDRVLAWSEEQLRSSFPFRAQIQRPITMHNTVQAFTQHGLFPKTALGWIANLTLTALTLGSWLLVYAVWLAISYGNFDRFVTVQALPSDQDGFSRVRIEASRQDWFDVVSGWLTERYGNKETQEA